MALLNSYGIWNNKGGVGKSTITFHVATRFAETNQDKNVLVIDLCPQSNSSMMLLGGGTNGESNVMKLCLNQPSPRTVVGYLSTVITNGQGAELPNPMQYTVKASDYNNNLTDNLFILCGDGNLEPISPAITRAADAPALTTTTNPWAWIHNIFRNFINKFSEVNSDKDLVVFIDTNPAFGIYTELAITSVDRLICPVNADDSSRTAANAMTILLHGTNPPHPIFGAFTFASQAQKYKTNIPKIHLIVGNRLTQYSGAATAFRALSDATSQALFAIHTSNPDYFSLSSNGISNIDDFKSQYSVPLRDFNTAGVVASHLGQLLSNMKESTYQVHGQTVQIDKQRINDCLSAIDNLILKL